MKDRFDQLRTVVQGGYCVGCGACAYVTGTTMNLNGYGEYAPDFVTSLGDPAGEKAMQAAWVCPSLNPELDEAVLGERLFAGASRAHDTHVGFYRAIYGGHVAEGNFRSDGTSGGFGTWIGVELHRRGLVDGVIHVKPSARINASDPFCRYAVSRTAEQIVEGAKTRYHVAELSAVLNEIKGRPGRYLFIGVPCMAKAVRRLQSCDSSLAEKIVFVASLVCGHMKSVHWSLSLAWAAGISPSASTSMDYRTKGPEIPARAYVFRAESRQGMVVHRDSSSITGGKFNLGALMVPACEYCDDLVGETADISIGDAWLPRFEAESSGSNLLILRGAELDTVIQNAQSSGRLHLERLTVQDVVNAQSGGFRQRREGLSHRLSRRMASGAWVPKKRIQPASFRLSMLRQWVYESRTAVMSKSRSLFREALETGNYDTYRIGLRFAAKKTRFLEVASSLGRILSNRSKRYWFRVLGVQGRHRN